MAHRKQDVADIRFKLREVTADRMLEDDEGEPIGVYTYLTDDEARWVVDTFEEMVDEIEVLKLDVTSARSRADQVERALRKIREQVRSTYSDDASSMASDPHWRRLNTWVDHAAYDALDRRQLFAERTKLREPADR